MILGGVAIGSSAGLFNRTSSLRPRNVQLPAVIVSPVPRDGSPQNVRQTAPCAVWCDGFYEQDMIEGVLGLQLSGAADHDASGRARLPSRVYFVDLLSMTGSTSTPTIQSSTEPSTVTGVVLGRLLVCALVLVRAPE